MHIGTEKTGTTYLQRFLARNQRKLAESGYQYPQFLEQRNHTKLAAPFIPRMQDLHKNLGLHDRAEIDALKDHLGALFARNATHGTWLFSSEHLSSRLREPAEVAAFADWMREYFEDVRFLVYLRRQDFLASSAYSTYIKSGGTAAWGMDRLTGGTYFDHLQLVSRWTAAAGADHVQVRPYLEEFKGGDALLDDFMCALGLTPGPDWIVPQPGFNVRLSAEGTEVLRQLNRIYPAFDAHGRPNMRRRRMSRIVATECPGPSWRLTPDTGREVLDHFAPGNAKLIAELTAGGPVTSATPELWQAWLDQPTDDAPTQQLTPERLAEILVDLGALGVFLEPRPALRHLSYEAGRRIKRSRLRR